MHIIIQNLAYNVIYVYINKKRIVNALSNFLSFLSLTFKNGFCTHLKCRYLNFPQKKKLEEKACSFIFISTPLKKHC